MTVSRAYRENSRISESTRKKVLDAATQLGYQPDPMVTELMSSFAGRRDLAYRETLAAIWWPERWATTTLRKGYSMDLRIGLENGAKHHGCTIEHHQLGKDRSGENIDRVLKARGIQGVILTPPAFSPSSPPAFDWDSFSFVSIGSSLPFPELHRAEPSHFKSFCKVLHEIHHLGFRNPCLLLQQDLEERMSRAYAGAFHAWETNSSAHLFHGSWQADKTKLNRWLRRANPDVIISDTTNWLPVIEPEFNRCGYISMDVSSPTGPIAGIYQNTRHIAESSIDLLLQLRRNNETGIPEYPRSLLSIGKWVEGKSLHGLENARSRTLEESKH